MHKQKKSVKIQVPAGIDHGQRIRISGEGEVGYRGSRVGDLYVVVRVRPHPEFKRDGADIYTEVPVSFSQAALGAKIEIDTVDGQVDLKIPAGIQSGKVLRLKNKGVPHLNGSGRGEHMVIARGGTPQKLTKKERELMKELASESGEAADVNESFWSKIKNSF